jgi:hypothetical protein
MAEIEPHHIDPGADQLFEHRGVAGCRTEGGNNFGGAAWHGMSPGNYVSIFTRKRSHASNKLPPGSFIE